MYSEKLPKPPLHPCRRLGTAIASLLLLSGARLAMADPVVLSSIEDIQLIGNVGTHPLDGDYVLAGDIVASATASWNAGAGFVPIGNLAAPFVGSFDGGGHVVSELTINRPTAETVGLFGYVGPGGVLTNVGIVDASITGGTFAVGTLAGWVRGGSVSRCSTTGSVASTDQGINAGGLLGWLDESLCEDSRAEVAVTVAGQAAQGGGLVGHCSSATIRHCSAAGSVSIDGPTAEGGGLVGAIGLRDASLLPALIERSFATGPVHATGVAYGGGLVGYVGRLTEVRESWAGGNVRAEGYPGGLAGYSEGTLSDCLAMGAVTAGPLALRAGGITQQIGQWNGTISRCLATGPITREGAGTTLGGIVPVALGENRVLASFWDTTATGVATSGGGDEAMGLMTSELRSLAPFAAAGWSISDGATPEFLWTIRPGEYPSLQGAQPIALSGDFTLTVGPDGDVGTLSALGHGIYSFALVPGPGDDDNASFEVLGDVLRAVSPSTLATRNYRVRVGATPSKRDSDSFETPLTISVLSATVSPAFGWCIY